VDFRKKYARKGVAGFTYKSSLNDNILGWGLRVEITYPK
jgi:hypothetical protein